MVVSLLAQKLFALALLVLICFSHANAQGDDKLIIFVDKSYPPHMYQVEKTEADGLYPRLLEATIKQAGLKTEIKALPWKRALLYSASGKGAVGGAYKSDERIKTYDYSAPLYQEKLVLFINKDKPFEFNSIEDLKGKVVGVNRGWSYGQAFDTARENGLFTPNVRNDPHDNFKILALGRIDCVILDQISGDSYTRILGIEDKVSALPNAFSINDVYLIIPKVLKMTPFLNDFNSALRRIREDGTYQKIVQTFVQEAMSD